MTLEDLHEVQKIGNELLLEVKRICKKNDIDFFLIHGTLLGAVRHKGTIPWDDDVDIAMTRQNYKKFIEAAKTELNEKYQLFIMGSGTIDYVSELKIGRKDTLYCAPDTEHLNIMKFVHLDVFLLDALKKPNKLSHIIIKTLRFVKLNWDEKKLIILNIKKSPKRIKLIYILLVYLSFIPRFVLGEKLLEHIIYNIAVDKTGETDYIGPVMDIDSFYWHKSDFSKTVELLYEGNKMPVPVGYDNILRNNYGDYMQEPDESQRYRDGFNEWIFKYT